MEPFDGYPSGGRKRSGGPKDWSNCRHGYGREVMITCKETSCAYCGLSLVDTYEHWLLMCVDHVVPKSVATELAVDNSFVNDFVNLVLACSGCNGFRNRYKYSGYPERPSPWTDESFAGFRDAVFADRKRAILQRRAEEVAHYEKKMWTG